MAETTRINGIAAAAIATGVVFAYAGVKGYSIPQTLQRVVTGKSPAGQAQVAAIGTPQGGSSGSGGGTSAAGGAGQGAIAGNARQVIGHAYRFGGAPGPNGDQPWDCSSCADWVVGKMSGLPIPGGSWAQATNNGAEHGPNTISWLSFSGAETVGHHSSVAVPGDLCVWQTHMGICVAPGRMVSALNPSEGTKETSIDGIINGELLFVRRIIIGNPHA